MLEHKKSCASKFQDFLRCFMKNKSCFMKNKLVPTILPIDMLRTPVVFGGF